MDLRAPRAGLQSQPPTSGWSLAQKTPCQPDYGCSAALPVPVVWSTAPLRLLLSLHSKPSFCSRYQLHQPTSKLQDSPAWGAGGEEAARLLLGIFPRSATVDRGGKECKHPTPSFSSKPAAQGFFSLNREGRVPEAGASGLQFTKEILLTASGRAPQGPSRSALASSSS